MNCPFCGGPTKIIDTEKCDRKVIRVRKCMRCGAAETTDENPRTVKNMTEAK